MQGPYRSIWTELLATRFRQDWVDAGGIKTRFVQAGRSDNRAAANLVSQHHVHVRFRYNNQNRTQITTNVCELSFALPKI